MSREDGHLRASEPQEEESPPGRDRPVVSARPGRWSGPDREPPLEDPALFINRELSLLEFNDRVLQLARDESNPLLERLRFLTISTSNLDEFFTVAWAILSFKCFDNMVEPHHFLRTPKMKQSKAYIYKTVFFLYFHKLQ